MKKNQGSALAIAVFVLSIALVGTIGFIFWQNYIAEPVADVDTNNSQNVDLDDDNDAISLANVVTDQTFDTNLSVRYPSDWAKTTTSNVKEGMGGETSIITSPDGKVRVHFAIGIGGIGGMCPEGESTISSVDADVIENYPDLRFASIVYDNGDDYRYYMGIQDNADTVANAVAGDDACAYYLRNLPEFKTLTSSHIELYAEFTDITNDDSTTKNAFEQIKDTENYNTAKAIIQSLYVK